MGLSLDFWLELAAIAVCFAVVITLIPKYRQHTINKAKAVSLRVQISEIIKLSLPAVAATSIQTLDDTGRVIRDSEALHYYSARLVDQRTESHVLYSDERERVQMFIDQLMTLIQAYDSGQLGSTTTEELLLLGERILLDLKENGLLSTVRH